MTTLIVNINDDKDLPVLREILTRFGLTFTVEMDAEYVFSEEQIASLVKTKQDFLDGKTTARSWDDIEEDLNRAYS